MCGGGSGGGFRTSRVILVGRRRGGHGKSAWGPIRSLRFLLETPPPPPSPPPPSTFASACACVNERAGSRYGTRRAFPPPAEWRRQWEIREEGPRAPPNTRIFFAIHTLVEGIVRRKLLVVDRSPTGTIENQPPRRITIGWVHQSTIPPLHGPGYEMCYRRIFRKLGGGVLLHVHGTFLNGSQCFGEKDDTTASIGGAVLR